VYLKRAMVYSYIYIINLKRRRRRRGRGRGRRRRRRRRRRNFRKNISDDTLTLDYQPPELGRNTFLIFELPSL
jgi:hypothetical protein